jgi:hypothetical protein
MFSDRHVSPTGLNICKIGFFASSRNVCSCGYRYAHVEVRFSDYCVTSITRAPTGKVHIIPGKRMSNPNYCCFFEIALESKVEEEMVEFAERYDAGFSSLVMYWNFAPILRNWPIRGWGTFCSAYVCRLLQIADLCQGMDPDRTSPDDLFIALAQDDRIMCSMK